MTTVIFLAIDLSVRQASLANGSARNRAGQALQIKDQIAVAESSPSDRLGIGGRRLLLTFVDLAFDGSLGDGPTGGQMDQVILGRQLSISRAFHGEHPAVAVSVYVNT